MHARETKVGFNWRILSFQKSRDVAYWRVTYLPTCLLLSRYLGTNGHLAGGFAAIARSAERDIRIDAKRDLLLLAPEAIGNVPQPATVAANQQIETTEVCELVVAFTRRCECACRSAWHPRAGIADKPRNAVPANVPAVPTASNGRARVRSDLTH